MPLTGAEIMQTHVITVSPEASLIDVQRLFFEEEIGAAPVVDDSEQVVGLITTTDLIRAMAEETESQRSIPDYMRDYLEFSGPDWSHAPDDIQDRLRQCIVSDFMTTDVCSVSPQATVPEIARTLRERRIHRVLVVEGGQLRGIISTFDLMALLEKAG